MGEQDRWMIVTRYVRDNGDIIRHIYAGESGEGWPTRARALTARKHHLKETGEHYGDEFVAREIKTSRFEINIVKVIDL